jgi:hypothetical protein
MMGKQLSPDQCGIGTADLDLLRLYECIEWVRCLRLLPPSSG